jgi:hypothetical protein
MLGNIRYQVAKLAPELQKQLWRPPTTAACRK